MNFLSGALNKAKSALGFGTHLNSGIPGVAPTDPTLGNLGDLGAAGSLHQYLQKLHTDLGPVVSFWWMDKLVVSVQGAAAMKDTIKLPNRPVMLFEMFMPLIGKESIQYANGEELAFRKKHYIDKEFTHKVITDMHWVFEEVARKTVDRWESLAQDGKPVNACIESIEMAMTSIMLYAFGGLFDEDVDVKTIREAYDDTWHEMEVRLSGDFPTEGSDRLKKFEAQREAMHRSVINIVKKLQARADEGVRGWIFSLINTPGISEEQVMSEAVTMMIGGFHTTGNLLAWALYYLATHPDVQDKVRAEVRGAMAGDAVFPTAEEVKQMPYVDQVVRETLRCSVLAPWAARYSDAEEQVGGYAIPSGTPIIQALGVTLQDPEVWPEPKTFNPDRFSSSEVAERASLSFSPFGFAGKRVCPGMRLANMEGAVILATLVNRFEISLAEGHPPVEPIHGLVTSPSVPVMLKISRKD